jgi:hypothetical protein
MKKTIIKIALCIAVFANQIDSIPNQIVPNPPIPVVDFSKPMILNHSGLPVVVYMHGSDVDNASGTPYLNPATLLNTFGLGIAINPGGGINFLSGTRAISVYHGEKEPVTANVQSNVSCTIRSSADKWTIS